MQQMTCPKCHGDMRVYERSGVTVDQCTECRGIFLDRGELEKLFEAEANWNPGGQGQGQGQPRPPAAPAAPSGYPPPSAPGAYAPPPPPPHGGGYAAPPPPVPGYGQPVGYPATAHGPAYGHHGHYRGQRHHGHYKRRKSFLNDFFD
jgi:hypothetical protein